MTPHRRRSVRVSTARIAMLAAATTALLPGCGSDATAFDPADWSFTDLEGNPHQLSDYRGKLVVVDLWATWCLPCRAIMPEMQRLHEEYAGRGVVILGGNTFERKDPAPLVRELGLTYPQLLETDPLADALKISALPAVIVYGINGEVVYQKTGGDEAALAELTAFIKQYADENGL